MKFPLVYESDNSRDSLCEEHGATLKHKCGKRIVALPLLSFSLSFLFIFLYFFVGFFYFFCKVRSLIPICGEIIVSLILSSLGRCSNNDDHHTFYLLTTQYYSI